MDPFIALPHLVFAVLEIALYLVSWAMVGGAVLLAPFLIFKGLRELDFLDHLVFALAMGFPIIGLLVWGMGRLA